MPSYAVQFTLFPSSNLNADASTNTWSFDADDVSGLGNAVTALRTFYNSLQSYYPSTVRQNSHIIKGYLRSDPKPRAPVLNQTFNFTTAPSGNPIPPEVSLCMSFQAPPLSGVSQARRRGRVYIGPLNTNALTTTGRPLAAFVTALVGAGTALRTASISAPNWAWTVYSVANANSPEISNGWVDDEFDTQRRRGRLPTARTVFP